MFPITTNKLMCLSMGNCIGMFFDGVLMEATYFLLGTCSGCATVVGLFRLSAASSNKCVRSSSSSSSPSSSSEALAGSVGRTRSCFCLGLGTVCRFRYTSAFVGRHCIPRHPSVWSSLAALARRGWLMPTMVPIHTRNFLPLLLP